MADQKLEQMMLTEFRRVTRGQKAARPLSGANGATIQSGGTADSQSTGLRPPSISKAASRVSQSASQSAAPAGQVNKGYSLPVAVAAPQATQSTPSSGGSVAGTIGQTALKVFTSGLGLMPLVSGLAGLFGGGSSPAPAPLTRYAMPQPIQIEAANSRSDGIQAADYGQNGLPRAYDPGAGATTAPQTNGTGAQQIVVNVQAMDSQSFLDRSSDIAQAVREAMLNMHPLNDVVSEL